MTNADANALINQSRRLDGKSYSAYKSLLGTHSYGDFKLHIDRVQSDPYAPPSSCRVTMSLESAGLTPQQLGYAFDDADRIAAADYIARRFQDAIRNLRSLRIAPIGQHILKRSSVTVTDNIEIRFQVQLPAQGRRIIGRAAADIFDYDIPDAVFYALDFLHPKEGDARRKALTKYIHTYRDYLALRAIVIERGWISFIADGSMLARASGISDLPATNGVPFKADTPLAATITLPHAGTIRGTRIERGITIIAGGGYHGKSTLLAAIEQGIWSHIPGDGRELVATVPDAMKIRAEDGRSISDVDISIFIRDLPNGADTRRFNTKNASGSTSQAAAIAEALESGCSALLIDEDTSATNLMIRDERMRALVRAEPITPLADRITELRDAGVSTLIVMGGSGDYLAKADTILLMENYECVDATRRAREILAKVSGSGNEISSKNEVFGEFDEDTPGKDKDTAENCTENRVSPMSPPDHERIASLVRSRIPKRQRPSERSKTKANGTHTLLIDREPIDVSAITGIVDPGQAEALAWAVRCVLESANAESSGTGSANTATLRELTESITNKTATAGLDVIANATRPAFLAEFRACDLAAAISRYRGLQLR